MMDLFPNAWTIARREFTQRVRTKTFLIVTLVLALVGLGFGLLPVIGKLIIGDQVTTIAVHSEDAELQSTTVAALRLILNASDEGATYDITAADDAAAAEAQVRSGDIEGLLTVTRGADEELSFDALTDAGPTDQRLFAVRQAATQVNIGDRLQRAGVDPADAAGIFAPTKFGVTRTNPESPNIEEDFGANYVMAYALVILTFMAVITYGTWVASSVAEEKSSRVMELLITAASPRQLLAGKVLGTGAAGLLQYVAVAGAAIVGFLLQGLLATALFGEGGSTGLEKLDLSVLLPWGIFFVAGFMLYAILYAGLGSMANRQEDIQQVTGPMIFVGMGGYFAAFVAMSMPDAAWAKVISVIPFFSPYMLPMRMLLSDVAPWEWVLGAVLMVLFLAGALWLAARVYSAGVLLYGQRANLRSAWRAVRVAR